MERKQPLDQTIIRILFRSDVSVPFEVADARCSSDLETVLSCEPRVEHGTHVLHVRFLNNAKLRAGSATAIRGNIIVSIVHEDNRTEVSVPAVVF